MTLPLLGLRVIEFSQMVMGPSCGLILADLGAEVIKIEPLKCDRTRFLPGVASGFFLTFSRNKKSLAIDSGTQEGYETLLELIKTSDVVLENFRPHLMKKQKLDYESLKVHNPKLIYCSLKGFLNGPYENRTALDEVVQMMGGLAYMTGLPNKPMRAGASVNDIMGGMFGVIAILASLRERDKTGKGAYLQSSLFENNVFLMGQAMTYESVTGQKALPWSIKNAPWPIYDLFTTKDETQLFVSVVGEENWKDFCREFGFEEWLTRDNLITNAQKVEARTWFMPLVQEKLKTMTTAEISNILEKFGLPFAPINTPSDLFEDPHLNASGGLLETQIGETKTAKIPALPIAVDGKRFTKRLNPPQIGEHTLEILREAGFTKEQVAKLKNLNIIS